MGNRVLANKYEILKKIGEGGMSVVYLAMDLNLNKQWAIKEIKKTTKNEKNEIVISSIIAEANLMKHFDHPSLPRIVDIFEVKDIIYIVMDYIEGESLETILKTDGAQKEEEVISWAIQLADALRYLHSRKPKIIYRDMKPANIMLKPEGNVKLIDFGIAREYKEMQTGDTVVLGTKGYAAPEQHGKRQTDERSDIYSLGMTMHHLLTGIDPKQSDYIYYSVRQIRSELSEGIEEIVDKCTEIDANNRYQNCDELIYDLQNINQINAYTRKEKIKIINTFKYALIIGISFLCLSFICFFFKSFLDNKDYESKINITESTSYEDKIKSYMEAIKIKPSDLRAYVKILEAYEQNQKFDDLQSNQFNKIINNNHGLFKKNSTEYQKLIYKLGNMYLYLYSGSDNSFRSRILKSYNYFSEIVKIGNKNLDFYDIAKSYSFIGEFYTNYIVSKTSIKEPNKDSYLKLLESLNVLIDNIDTYKNNDSSHIKLVIYREILNLINVHSQGIIEIGINKNEILKVMKKIYDKTIKENVTQPSSLKVKQEILKAYDVYLSLLNDYGSKR